MSVDGEDRLSLLPDDIIHQILSHIDSTKQHVQISILSKRFRRIGSNHSNLHFSSFGEFPSYISSVSHFLTHSHTSPFINLFTITLADENASYNWFRMASAKSVQRIVIYVVLFFRIPRSLYFCKTLTSLSVLNGRLRKAPINYPGFPNLKHLSLSCTISDEVIHGLLNSCPALEILKLIACSEVHNLRIKLPKLKYLVINNDLNLNLIVDASNLSFICVGGSFVEVIIKSSFDALSKAEIFTAVGCEQGIKFLNAASNVNVLVVSDYVFEFWNSDIFSKKAVFENLKEVTCMIHNLMFFKVNYFMNFLGQCPFLEKLVTELSDTHPALSAPLDYIDLALEDEEVLHILDYSLLHLKSIYMLGYIGTKKELQLCKFLLEKALVLEKFVLCHFRDRKEQEIHGDFTGITSASSKVQVIIQCSGSVVSSGV